MPNQLRLTGMPSVGDPLPIDMFQDGDIGNTITQEQIDEIKQYMEMQSGISNAQREAQINALGGDFDENLEKYTERLGSMVQPPRRMNIYDLASELGAGLLSTPNIGGASAYTGLGVGFTRASQSMKKARENDAKIRQQIAMKAFELAHTDEKAANDFLNQVSLAAAKKNPDLATSDYIVTSEIPIMIGNTPYPTGSIIPLTKEEHYKNRTKVTSAPKMSPGVKVAGSGHMNRYLSREDAEKTIEGLGLDPESPFFESTVDSITANSPAQIGTNIISGGQYTQLVPFVQNGKVFNILTAPITGGLPPPYIKYRDNRMTQLANTEDANRDKHFTVLPSVDRAMMHLMNGTETGKLADVTLPFRQFVHQAFGVDDPALLGLEDIMGISNYLAPKMRPVGSGSTSDMEFKAYQNALLSLEKTPASNYIALYAYKKMVMNGLANNKLEKELLADQTITDVKVLNERLRMQDDGIFVKLPDDIHSLKDETAADGLGADYTEAVNKFWESLPKGAVFDNSEGVFTGLGKAAGPFMIKGWQQNLWSNP